MKANGCTYKSEGKCVSGAGWPADGWDRSGAGAGNLSDEGPAIEADARKAENPGRLAGNAPHSDRFAGIEADIERLAAEGRTYCCIDLKSFYASVECVERGLDPFKAPLVVADPARGTGTICLAVSPALKAKGVPGRPRVFQIPRGLDYMMAPPRMGLYMERSADIVGIYLEHVSAEDLHVYSIDECFMDLTPYALTYGDPAALARRMKDDVFERTGISATVGIGRNLFQAKVALDILAKHMPDGVAELDYKSFRDAIWPHRPITDIWGIARGISRRLESHGIHDMGGLAHADIPMLYKEFGVNAEYLFDHAWGVEPCTIAEIHSYVPKGHSINSGQVLMRDYAFDEARRVAREEVEEAVLDMISQGLVTNHVSFFVGYSKEAMTLHSGGSRKLPFHTSSFSRLAREVDSLYMERVSRDLPIRRVGVGFSGLIPEGASQMDLFASAEGAFVGKGGGCGERDRGLSCREEDAILSEAAREAREQSLMKVMAEINAKYGRGASMHGTTLMPGATGLERATLVGGHRAW